MSDAWYEEVDSVAKLLQGDLIANCPLVSWKSDLPRLNGSREAELLRGMVHAIQADVVVMTQACDLEQRKVQNVVCPHLALTKYFEAWNAMMETKGQNPTEKAWHSHCDDIRDGFVWNLTILNKGKTNTISTEHRIVDFHEIFTVPAEFLESLLQQRGQPRIRLLPPYREHLSQAFARFFMRVGLPTPITRCW